MSSFLYGSIPLMAEKISRLPLIPAEELPDLYNESLIIRRGHLIGYIPFSRREYLIGMPFHLNATILTCMCFESGGIGLSVYPSLEIADSLRNIHPVRFLIPTYEYRTYKLLPDADIKRKEEEARKLLNNKGFEVIDVSEEPYISRRLEMFMRILPYMKYEDRLHAYPLGDGNLQLALGALEIADIFLCVEDHGNTVVVSDEGCAGPVITAKRIAKYLGYNSENLGTLAYCEAVGLDGKSTMYAASETNKLHLMNDDPDSKIRHAITTGGKTKEEHANQGGKPYQCPVQIVHSMIAHDDALPNICAEGCMKGALGCTDHKELVMKEYELFMREMEGRI